MILIIVLVLVLVGLAGAGLLGIGVLSADSRRERSGILAALSAPVVLGIGVLLLAVLVLGVGGRQSGGDDPPSPPTSRRGPAPTATTLPSARVQTVPAELPVVTIHRAEADRFSAYEPLSGLRPDMVVHVKADGFGWHERGSIEQCVVELGRQTSCTAPFPVQFDGDGRAEVQFQVRGDFAPGGCRLGQATCLLRVRGDDPGREGTSQVVLVDRLTPGRVTLEPARSIADGQTVQVAVTGFPAGATASAVLCAPPGAYDARHCSAPSPASTFTVDASGSGRTTLVVAAGRLGTDGALCGPRRLCAVAVVVGPGFVAAPPAPIAFSAGPGPAYTADRLLAGIGIAAVLIALAVIIAVRTDWAKPKEADAPELEAADLRADQTLDDLFGTDAELDERHPIPW